MHLFNVGEVVLLSLGSQSGGEFKREVVDITIGFIQGKETARQVNN